MNGKKLIALLTFAVGIAATVFIIESCRSRADNTADLFDTVGWETWTNTPTP